MKEALTLRSEMDSFSIISVLSAFGKRKLLERQTSVSRRSKEHRYRDRRLLKLGEVSHDFSELTGFQLSECIINRIGRR